MEPDRIPQLGLDLDPAFENFNFSELLDPTMKSGPTKVDLYRLVHKGRLGDRHALAAFADAMYWTLRQAAFDAYQREHGSRAITHREWFYHKLFQFCEILLFTTIEIAEGVGLRSVEAEEAFEGGNVIVGSEGQVVQLDELEDALSPEDNNSGLWLDLARAVSAASNDRLAVAQDWLQSRAASQLSPARRSKWTKNQERDQIISNCQGRGMSPELICEELDRRTIDTIPALRSKGIHQWMNGWANPQTRNAIRQLFSKLPRR